MRVFLILLLLANIGYLAWRQDWLLERQDSRPEAEPDFRPAEQGLALLRELPAARLQLMSSLAEARNARTQAVQQLEQVEDEVEEVVGEIDENRPRIPDDPARDPEVVDLAPPADTNAPIEQANPPAATTGIPWCAATSDFEEQADAAAFVAGLAELGVAGEVETRAEPVSSTWWVHMPAFASEAEARTMLAELQGRGIDSYFMRTGEMAGGISLGVYSRQESAAIAQRQLADQGYATSVREVFRTEERSSVRLRMVDGTLRNSPEWGEFLAAAAPIEVTEFTCEPIASEIEFP